MSDQKKLANSIMSDFAMVREELKACQLKKAFSRLWKIHLDTVELVRVIEKPR